MEESKRWIVTYTKHVRQKRKVYQDGMLELHNPSNKVLLYDDSGKLLDSRFLKKDDLIECGATLAFETHLVDIGDLDETQKPLQNFKVSGSDRKPKEKPEICGQTSKNSFLEWDVLYTAQITQKAKRYHDGILKLISCGTHMNQLILLREDGTTLSSKFQKSGECMSMGNTYEMPNYLVEICKQRDIQEERQRPQLHNRGKLQNCASSEKTSIKEGVEESKNNPSENEVTRSSAVSRFSKREETLKNKPFRDAFEIISILRRPQESLLTGKLVVGQTCPSQSLDSFHPDLEGSGVSLKSVALPEIPSSGTTKLLSPDCKVELVADNCCTSSSLYAKEQCNASINHPDGESTKKNSLELEESSIQSETSSTANSLKIWMEEPLESCSEGEQNLDLCSSELQIEEQANSEKPSQLHSDGANSEKEGSERVHSSAAASLSWVTGFPGADPKDKDSEFKISLGKSADPDDFPSFDLGIEL